MESRVPAEVFPPGDSIREELEARGWTQRDLAAILGRGPHVVSSIIAGKTGISPDTARGLAAAFSTSPDYWLNLEASYRLHKDPSPIGDNPISQRARMWGKAPVREMIKRGWIEDSSNPLVLERQLLDFYGIDDLDDEPAFWSHAARKSTEYGEASPDQTAWLFRCRQLAEASTADGFTKTSVKGVVPVLRALAHDLPSIRRVPVVLAEGWYSLRCSGSDPRDQVRRRLLLAWAREARDRSLAPNRSNRWVLVHPLSRASACITAGRAQRTSERRH